MTISKRLRYEVLRRDGHKCWYCGTPATEVKLVVDAVVPEALGGSHKDPANLRAACEPCNSGKTSSSPDAPLVAAVAEDAAKWADAMRAAQARMLADLDARTARLEQFAEWWDGWTYGEDKQPIPKDPGWQQSVENILAAGLPMRVLEECVGVTMAARKVKPENTFRYMCGVAWNKVRELQDNARLVAHGESVPASATTSSSPFDDGRAEAAEEVLGELTDGDREKYIEWADDGGWGDAHGEPQTDADRVVGAATSALNDIYCDLSHLQQSIVSALAALPGGIGGRAMKTARETLYDRMGADFSKMHFATESLRQLDDELRYPEAGEYLRSLPGDESAEWIIFALTLYENSHVGERGITVRAARCAQVVAQGSMYTAMCGGTGKHIKACTERATHYALIAGMDCCAAGVTEDHPGHGVCERHLEQLVDGTFVSSAGNIRTAIDFTEIAVDAGVPF